jgi:hypothetical protein
MSDDIRCLYSNCNKDNQMNQDKNVILVVSQVGECKRVPSCWIEYRAEIYVLKTRMQVKKCEVKG